VQLWVALPEADRDTAAADFTHLAQLPTFSEAGATVTVLMGELAGHRSAAPSFSPLVGAEVRLTGGASLRLPVERDFEYAVLAVGGPLRLADAVVEPQVMSFLGDGRAHLKLEAPEGDVIALLLGGVPFEEQILMWWNFIGRSHDEIVEQREDWNGTGLDFEPDRYGVVRGFAGDRLLAPPMPTTRLRPRGRVA
jgi:redox-sensitive bicupin YhaK (pirin superfamily)